MRGQEPHDRAFVRIELAGSFGWFARLIRLAPDPFAHGSFIQPQRRRNLRGGQMFLVAQAGGFDGRFDNQSRGTSRAGAPQNVAHAQELVRSRSGWWDDGLGGRQGQHLIERLLIRHQISRDELSAAIRQLERLHSEQPAQRGLGVITEPLRISDGDQHQIEAQAAGAAWRRKLSRTSR